MKKLFITLALAAFWLKAGAQTEGRKFTGDWSKKINVTSTIDKNSIGGGVGIGGERFLNNGVFVGSGVSLNVRRDNKCQPTVVVTQEELDGTRFAIVGPYRDWHIAPMGYGTVGKLLGPWDDSHMKAIGLLFGGGFTTNCRFEEILGQQLTTKTGLYGAGEVFFEYGIRSICIRVAGGMRNTWLFGESLPNGRTFDATPYFSLGLARTL